MILKGPLNIILAREKERNELDKVSQHHFHKSKSQNGFDKTIQQFSKVKTIAKSSPSLFLLLTHQSTCLNSGFLA